VGKLNAILANAQLANGTAADRWSKTLNVILEKLTGNDNIKKLQIIMLFEVDFNHNNKWLGQGTMKLAEARTYWPWSNMAAGRSRQQAPNVLTNNYFTPSIGFQECQQLSAPMKQIVVTIN